MAVITFRGLGDSHHCPGRVWGQPQPGLGGLGTTTIGLRGGFGESGGDGTVMTSRMLSRLCTLSPGNTSFITVSFPSCEPQTPLGSFRPRRPLSVPIPLSPPDLSPSPHRLGEEELQLAVLQHVDTGIGLSGAENVVTLLALLENHVLAKLQEQRLLKVTQHPARDKDGDKRVTRSLPQPALLLWSHPHGRLPRQREEHPSAEWSSLP